MISLMLSCLLFCLVAQTLAFSPAPVANINERCGENLPTCNVGLYCDIPRRRKTGVCKRGLAVGAYCEAPRKTSRPPCGNGLVCQKSGRRGLGKCVVPKAKLGQSCGGGTLFAMSCKKGLYCYYEHTNLPGAPGICKKGGKEGDRCMAFTNPPQPPCADGFTCILTNPQIPDLGGKCHEYRIL